MAIRAIDTVITFRILKLLTTKWVDQSAYKEGLIDDKGKRKPIIQSIYDAVIEKGYFNQDIRSDKFKKLKLKAQSLHTELGSEINSYYQKNFKNKHFSEFVDKQVELKNNLLLCEQLNEIEKWHNIIKKNIETLKKLKKSLKN